MKGKIVLVHFPFTDLTATKLRPAVIHESDEDVVVAFISSRIPPESIGPELVVHKNHPGFLDTGLKVPSVIRFTSRGETQGGRWGSAREIERKGCFHYAPVQIVKSHFPCWGVRWRTLIVAAL